MLSHRTSWNPLPPHMRYPVGSPGFCLRRRYRCRAPSTVGGSSHPDSHDEWKTPSNETGHRSSMVVASHLRSLQLYLARTAWTGWQVESLLQGTEAGPCNQKLIIRHAFPIHSGPMSQSFRVSPYSPRLGAVFSAFNSLLLSLLYSLHSLSRSAISWVESKVQ